MGISWTINFSTLSTFSLIIKFNPRLALHKQILSVLSVWWVKFNPRCQSHEQVLSGLSRWCCPLTQTQWTLPPDAPSSLLTLGETENAKSAFFPLSGRALARFLWSQQPVRSAKSWSFICATKPPWHKKKQFCLFLRRPPPVYPHQAFLL